MNILLTAATLFEIQPAIEFLTAQEFRLQKSNFNVLITGVGGMATTYHLTKSVQEKKPDFIIQGGIAGSFRPEISIGSVVGVVEELLGDLGAEENNEFKDVFDMALMNENDFPFTRKILINPLLAGKEKYGVRGVRSVGINEVITRKERIELIRKKYNPDIESMEGAAFHYVCLHLNCPFLQLRSISNYAGERNKINWNIKAAIENLNTKLIEVISSPF